MHVLFIREGCSAHSHSILYVVRKNLFVPLLFASLLCSGEEIIHGLCFKMVMSSSSSLCWCYFVLWLVVVVKVDGGGGGSSGEGSNDGGNSGGNGKGNGGGGNDNVRRCFGQCC